MKEAKPVEPNLRVTGLRIEMYFHIYENSSGMIRGASE